MEIIRVFPKLFSRRWWLTTLIVIAGVYVLIQLGFWQLDRLEQRREFNLRVQERWLQDPFDLTTNALPANLSELEYRRVQISGEYDYNHQILLSNQTRNGAPGAIFVTPLVLDDGRAVLVARGWVPVNEADPEQWANFDEAATAPIVGLIQESQTLPNGRVPTPPAEPQREWYTLNINAIQPQMPYELLPVFILQLPEEGRSLNQLPLREEPIVLNEGSHFSYAIQWFMFAAIFGIGYLFFIQTQELREQRLAAGGTAAGTLAGDPPGDEPDAGIRPSQPLPPQQGHA